MTLRFEKQWRAQFAKPESKVKLTSIPEVTTQAVSDIAGTTATGNGNIIDLGGASITQHGMCWSVSQFPTTLDYKTEEGGISLTGPFTSSITGLSAETIYYVRAYVTNSFGTVYGEQVAITTLGFVFTVVTTIDSESFTLPIYNGGIYDFTINWGDGSSDTITTWDDVTKEHTYVSANTYTINIVGTITGFRFNNTGDKTKIYDISQWGNLNLGNLNGYFWGCSNLTVTATDTLDLTNMTTFETMFSGCSSIVTIPGMDSWDVSNITSMASMFSLAVKFNQSLNSWDVSAVENMTSVFINAIAFNGNIASWVPSACTTMRQMFMNATAFNQDIGSWNTGNVTSMYRMFYLAVAFDQDIGSWNTVKVTTMYEMFRSATAFDQDLSSWVVTALTAATTMFYLSSLTDTNYSALLVGWEAQAVQDNVNIHGGTAKYSAGAAATARQDLIDDHTWGITDGGPV